MKCKLKLNPFCMKQKLDFTMLVDVFITHKIATSKIKSKTLN